jgi:4-diphosphocytidyl-2-C-methyl-D-erythritol kinase
MKIATPAKINLTLEIVGPRSDGYHDLKTWMLPIGLADLLGIDEADETSFFSNATELQNDSSNLIIRAIEEFARASSIKCAYRIRLEKKIPIGAGLGGGSTNAAGALRLLNRIHGNPLSDEHLHELAASLGSDVAFFLTGRSAWCTGRGEKLESRQFPTNLFVFLAKPGFGVSTAGAYRAYAELPAEKKRGESQETPWGMLRNDLEPAVFPKYVLLRVIKTWMKEQPESMFSLMSGSGSTLFAVIESREDGTRLAERFHQEFGRAIWGAVLALNPLTFEPLAEPENSP